MEMQRAISLFLISTEHQITTASLRSCAIDYCFSFQQSIKSQPGSARPTPRRIVSHFNRASNHNLAEIGSGSWQLFLISTEHQITTARRLRTRKLLLFLISTEHQITTHITIHPCRPDCFSFQQSIKSQLQPGNAVREPHCFSFQQSIKSQHRGSPMLWRNIVSHFNRASNHNPAPRLARHDRLFLISTEHQITTIPSPSSMAFKLFLISTEHQITTDAADSHPAPRLFLISTEHQITTVSGGGKSILDCFSFQQSIKSQQETVALAEGLIVSHFNRASNHNPKRAWVLTATIVSHFNRASNHNRT